MQEQITDIHIYFLPVHQTPTALYVKERPFRLTSPYSPAPSSKCYPAWWARIAAAAALHTSLARCSHEAGAAADPWPGLCWWWAERTSVRGWTGLRPSTWWSRWMWRLAGRPHRDR